MEDDVYPITEVEICAKLCCPYEIKEGQNTFLNTYSQEVRPNDHRGEVQRNGMIDGSVSTERTKYIGKM